MEYSYESSSALARNVEGPLSRHVGAFTASLIEQRYSARCVHFRAYRAADFDRWLVQEGVALCDVDDRHVDRYHRDRSQGRHLQWRNELRALRELLCFLRDRRAIAQLPPLAKAPPANEVAIKFGLYLRQSRGLAAGTIRRYSTFVRQFLNERFGNESIKLDELRVGDVVETVQSLATRMQPHALKQLVTAIRSFLRYAQYRGDVAAELVAAVPAVACWATTPPLPRAISAEHARRVIAHCDVHTPAGRRDHAILLLLARLGLRSGDIVNMTLDDVDWDEARLRVCGKAGRECFMPLPAEVGKAIAAYLQQGRPASTDRHLFLRLRAPIRSFTRSDAVGTIVAHALARAGIDAPHKGAHQFRHALAVQMLQRGASLPEIGELLRHRSPQATAIYARVDLSTLRELAQPWPKEAA